MALGIDTLVAQGRFDRLIALDRVRIIEPRPMHGPCPGFRHKRTQHLKRITLAQNQTTALALERAGHFRQRQAKPPFWRGAKGGNADVMDENWNNRPTALAGRNKCGMIRETQIAPQP